MNQASNQLELLNASFSYYSMVAILALIEVDMPFHNYMLEDSEVCLTLLINELVSNHYLISIEDLTLRK